MRRVAKPVTSPDHRSLGEHPTFFPRVAVHSLLRQKFGRPQHGMQTVNQYEELQLRNM
jgi:hypothetical protein